jgi:SAM-dependent methyltransferase
MLKYARENALPYMAAGQARFLQGDASLYTLDETFGLVVSTFNALNHLPDMASLEGCFQSTLNVLRTGGWFIFDLNTRAGLLNWNRISIDPAEDVFLVNRGIFDGQMGKAWTKITGFVQKKGGAYIRFEETVYNTVFEMEAVKSLLEKLGFQGVYFAKGSDLNTAIIDPESEAKVFFVSHK